MIGEKSTYIEANLNKISDNTFSIKEIIIYGKQNFFLNGLVNQIVKYSKIILRLKLFSNYQELLLKY